MLHIATVHYETDKWIDIQLDFLKRNIKQEYRVYAFLSGEAIKHKDKFYFACCEPITEHAVKLNLLSIIIKLSASDKNDTILFLDGDAFPIVPIDNYILNKLKEFPLIAIQTIENVGDIQPHPSFCITTIKFWEEIDGDWKKGAKWICSNNTYRDDVGALLLKKLDERNIEWGKIHRTSQLTDHGKFMGIYGGTIYHHGAGFRDAFCNLDRETNYIFLRKIIFPFKIKNTKVNSFIQLMISVLFRRLWLYKRIIRRNNRMSQQVFNKIQYAKLNFDFNRPINSTKN